MWLSTKLSAHLKSTKAKGHKYLQRICLSSWLQVIATQQVQFNGAYISRPPQVQKKEKLMLCFMRIPNTMLVYDLYDNSSLLIGINGRLQLHNGPFNLNTLKCTTFLHKICIYFFEKIPK